MSRTRRCTSGIAGLAGIFHVTRAETSHCSGVSSERRRYLAGRMRRFDEPPLQRYGAVVLGLGGLFLMALLLTPSLCRGEDSNTQVAATARTDETNSLETLRAFLQLQEQLHQTQLAIEQNRKEAKDTAAQSAQVLADRLAVIERALSTQRARELEAMQSSNRVMLTVAGTFAAVGFIAMLLMAYFQWRTVHALAEVSAALPTRALGPAPALAALGAGDAPLVTAGPAPQANLRLLGTLDRLEKRIYQLEHTAPQASLHEGTPAGESLLTDNGHPPTATSETGSTRPGPVPVPPEGVSRFKLLLGKGQSMLSLDKAEAALKCFEEALALEPANAEALIKQGIALERLQKLDEAIECYDRAITADGSMTIAYLHKGGLFNRMERFNEALECYEQALRTQEKRHT